MAINLHEFTGEERVDTELAPLLNENFNALKDYADDASRWQILPVQFSGDNVKYLLQETSLSAANTTYVLPLIKIDDTNVASACDLRFIILKENGSINGISADIKLQKISSTNCAVNYSFTSSEDITLEPCTFTYNSVKYAGLKITVGADLPECIWANGFITETWQDAIAYKSGETVSNNEINNSIQVLGSDMVLVANMFKHLQTDKSPVSDYDVVNKKSLNDLTNVKTYSALSQIGLSGDVLDFHPYTIGNALPANSMLIIGIGGDTNNYNYPVTMGNLTVVRANTNHVLFQIDQNDSNGYNTRYVLEYSIDTASVSSPTNWKQILTDIDTGYWQPNETVTKGTVRKLLGAKYAGCFLVCKVAGTTGSTYPSPNPEDGAGLGGGGSSNLTVYTSLEQIGIVKGNETFASICDALTVPSSVTYYASSAQDYADIYPYDYGNFTASRLTGDNLICTFVGTNGIIYTTNYHQVSQNVPVWVACAKQEDLTSLSNNVVKRVDTIVPVNGNIDMMNWLHRYPYTDFTNGLTTQEWTSKGIFSTYFSGETQTFPQKPADHLWGQLLNLPPYYGSEVFQLYIAQPSGKMYRRGTNQNEELDEVPFVKLLDMDDVGSLIGGNWTISKGTNGWARESSTGLTLQWGVVSCNLSQTSATFTFPKVFTECYQAVATPTNYPASGVGTYSITNITNSNLTIYGDYSHNTATSQARIIAIGIS